MIRRLSTLVLTMFAVVSIMNLAGQAQSTPITRHTREDVTSRVAPLVGRLPATQNMRLTLVLPQRNQTELHQFVKDVYDRSNPSFHHFLTVEQFTQKFGPAREDYESVKAFARENGLKVEAGSRNRMIVQVSGSVQNVEKALHVTMGLYQHPTENRIFFAPDREPSPNMSVRLWAISGLDTYSRPTRNLVRRDPNAVSPQDVNNNATIGSGPQNSFLGSDMRAAYYGGTALDGAGQSLGLFEFIGTDLDDLTTYYTNVGQTNNVPVTVLSVDGAPTTCFANQGCDDTEQTLDMTQALGMAPGMSSLVMYVGNGGLGGPLDDPGILNGMATANPLNSALSCSWAWRPPDPTTDDPFFLQFAAQGQSFFTASGDSGKWKSSIFVWPADDPNLTSVGGTDLKTSSAAGPWASETAWIDSGGGITPNNFAIPSYQVTAAAGCASCSQTLRNGPDVSANADFTFYVCSDQSGCTANQFGGTSFAAPMWAGFIALVNQQAVANGESTVGFINPAIYALYSSSGYTTDFHDITTGSQTGGTFTATVGYDLVTGIGSPNGQALIDALAPGGSGGGTFTVSAAPKLIAASRGGSTQTRVTVTGSGGFTGTVALTATVSGGGVHVLFNPASVHGSGTSAMHVRVAPNAATGTRTITVTGTSGSETETTTVTLNIN